MPHDTCEMAATRSLEFLLEIPMSYVPGTGQQGRRHGAFVNITNGSFQSSIAAPRRRPTSQSILQGQRNQETMRGP